MPKSAAQRLTPAQIRAALNNQVQVAVATGFKRGFAMNARPAMITAIGIKRTVFANADDVLGRSVTDGVMVKYRDAVEDGETVAPSDVIDLWDHYVNERDDRTKARAAAAAATKAQLADLQTLAKRTGGTVMCSPAGQAGILLTLDQVREYIRWSLEQLST